MNRRLLAGFLLFATLVVVGLEIPFGLTLTDDTRATHVGEVVSDASTLSYLVDAASVHGDLGSAGPLLSHFATSDGAIVVVAQGVRPLMWAGAGASEELADPATQQILRLAARGRAAGEEGSRDPDDDLLYATAPLIVRIGAPSGAGQPGRSDVHVVLLVATSAAPLHDAVRRDVERLIGFGVLLLAVSAIIGALLARSLTRPLASIESVVAAHGRGLLASRAATDVGPAELRAHARTVNDMAARVEELLVAQRAFVADAAHQLRSPLTALRLRLENLPRLHPELAGTELTSSLAEADRLSRVIDGLLALARVDGARPLRATVDVGTVLTERTDAWRALAAEQGIELALELGGAGSGQLLADACPGYVDQVLDNLLANAVDASRPGGTIRLSGVVNGAAVELHVEDNGVGMSDDERRHAFDRFWRTPRATGEGSGLGLAIVAQLVRACGGTCELRVGRDGGTDAVAVIPSSRSHVPDVRAATRVQPGKS